MALEYLSPEMLATQPQDRVEPASSTSYYGSREGSYRPSLAPHVSMLMQMLQGLSRDNKGIPPLPQLLLGLHRYVTSAHEGVSNPDSTSNMKYTSYMR